MQEDTVEGLKRMVQEVVQEMDERKAKVSKLEGDVLEKKTVMKATNLLAAHLGEQKKKLVAVNKSLRVSNEDIISLPMNRLCPKGSGKVTKKLREDIEVQYHGNAIAVKTY